ncbi:MAG: putative hydrocarbon binding protein [Candidatus Nitrosomirales archaeon]|jgi:predicted hydrocarbon binding protein
MAEHNKPARVDANHSMDSSVYLNSFFHFDPKTNQTQDLVFNCAAMLTNEEFWRTVQEGLFSAFKSGGPMILYHMGLKYGFAVGSRAREAKQDVYEAVKFLETYGLFAGWGRFKTFPFRLSMGRLAEEVTVKVEGSFFARSLPKTEQTHEPKCFIIAGLLAGIAEGLLGESHICIETTCMATGAQYCEFRIRPINNFARVNKDKE